MKFRYLYFRGDGIFLPLVCSLSDMDNGYLNWFNGKFLDYILSGMYINLKYTNILKTRRKLKKSN